MRRFNFFYKFATMFMAFALIVLFQNCSPHYNFLPFSAKTSQEMESNAGGGNGGTYDGKPRIYHHYVDNFTCEGLARPESILIQTPDLKWLLIKNELEKCASLDRVPVENVTYNAATNQASYQGTSFSAPGPYFVDASEDANLDDVALDDGVCANRDGKCSLRAALQQAAMTSETTDVLVNVPPLTYDLLRPLQIPNGSAGKSITVRGADPATTILDGKNSFSPLIVTGRSNVHIENIKFARGQNNINAFGEGSAIILRPDQIVGGGIHFLNCQFEENSGNPSVEIYPSIGNVSFRKSRFVSNNTTAIRLFSSRGLILEDTLFSNNTGRALDVANQSYDITIRRSSFISNQNGVRLHGCINCMIESSTIYQNTGYGLVVSNSMTPEFAAAQINVINTTIVENGITTGASNIALDGLTDGQLALTNSIVAQNSPLRKNCTTLSPTSLFAVTAKSTLFDDDSCNVPNTDNNLFGSAEFYPLAYNDGGLTPTLLVRYGSLAFQTADPQYCPLVDQNGYKRTLNPATSKPYGCDRGSADLLTR